MKTAAAGIVVAVVAACTGSSLTLTSHDAGRNRASSDPATSGDRDARPEPAASSRSETATATPVVNGRITSAQGHLRKDVSSYQWLAFDSGSDTGLVVSYRFCRHCRPRGIELERFTVVGPAGRVATLACSDGASCRAQVRGNAATLGPGADEVTVESGDRTMTVLGFDGTPRRTLDLTATLARGRDIRWLAWSPDGSRLAVLTGRGRHGSDIWLVDGDGTPELAYSGNNPWMLRPAWSPDGQRLLVDQMVPRRGRDSFRDSGADVVVFHRSSAGSSPAMTPQVLYRSNRGFDNAGNLAWSPDGTRIAVRTSGGLVEVSAEDGTVLARHPQNRGNSGWLIWLRDR